jgi:hypothetical protein
MQYLTTELNSLWQIATNFISDLIGYGRFGRG